eukprot:scaffold248419_cov28-Tisochrysis_lutea.AAC.2
MEAVALHVGGGTVCGPHVDSAPLGDEQQVVNHLVDGPTRLMDHADDGDTVLVGKLAQRLDYALRLERVEPRRRLPLALAARDAAALHVTHDGVGRFDERQLPEQAVDDVLALRLTYRLGQPQPCREEERLAHCHLRVEDILLPHKRRTHARGFLRDGGDRRAVDKKRAGERGSLACARLACQRGEQRGFARAGRPHDGEETAGLDIAVNLVCQSGWWLAR